LSLQSQIGHISIGISLILNMQNESLYITGLVSLEAEIGHDAPSSVVAPIKESSADNCFDRIVHRSRIDYASLGRIWDYVTIKTDGETDALKVLVIYKLLDLGFDIASELLETCIFD